MNVKLQIGEVVRLIDNRISMEQVCKQLAPLAEQARIELLMPQTGVGYLQWSLPGDGWFSFSKADGEQKATVARHYHERCEHLRAALKNSPLKDVVLTVPSEDFIYFQKKGLDYDISLVAWGYKFPNQPPCSELNTWISRIAMQKVCIGFKWDENLLSNYNFMLENFKRQTSSDGLFYIDGLLPVGKEYQIKTHFNTLHILKVEQGKEKYIYDLTQFVYIDITVQKDSIAIANCPCKIDFNGKQHQLETDGSGTISLKLPLACTPTGEFLQPQPTCRVMCQSEEQEQTPLTSDEKLVFNFSFQTEKKPSSSKPETPQKPEPPLPPVPPTVEPKPKFVDIKLLDYGGFPMVDLDFTLVTKKKGSVSLKTNADGICRIPKEWLTHKEKFRIKVKISPEYQEIHDLHDVKNKKK